MPAKRLSMRLIREIARLHARATISNNGIDQQIGFVRNPLSRFLKRLVAAGLNWPLQAKLIDAKIK